MRFPMVLLAAVALAFLLLMHNIRGLRIEKVLKEGADWQEIHLVWDWNKMAAWGKEHRPFQKIEREQKEKTSEKADTDTPNKKK